MNEVALAYVTLHQASYVNTQSACTILIKRLSLIYRTYMIILKHIRPGIKHASFTKFITYTNIVWKDIVVVVMAE